jgi:hypothetical protein
VVGRREQGASPSHYYILLLVSLRACQAKAFPTEGGEREGAKGGEREYPAWKMRDSTRRANQLAIAS